MTWLKPELIITLSVIVVVLLVAGFSALAQYAQRVQRVLELAERCGLKIRQFKDQQLQNFVSRIPIPADVMTGLRLLATIGCLVSFQYQQTVAAVSQYVLAWLFDLLDGLKARAEQIRRGRPTPWGKYLDPAIDLICFALLIIALGRWYQYWLVMTFAILIAARVVLFLIILIGRLIFRRWRDRLCSNILPESIAGKFKTVFIALSFGLIILGRSNATLQAWAWSLLGIALVLEVISLLQQMFRASRILYRPVTSKP